MKKVQIKICGVTTPEDAAFCAAAGASMIGLNFYSGSPRCLTTESASQILRVLPKTVEAVGVFVEATAAEAARVANSIGLRTVQLHGRLEPETCRALASDFRVIRAARSIEEANGFAGDILFDAFDERLHGGTGKLCDWSAARIVREQSSFFILAGGLNAGNVADAIRTVSPDAVDVCSGVEKSPGVKNREAIRQFIAGSHI